MNTPVSFVSPNLTPSERRQVFRAVHSAMAEKPSSFTSYIQKRVEITIPEIEQLCVRIHQYFSSFDIINNTFESEISMNRGSTKRDNNIYDFKSFNEAQAESVTDISINLKYIIMSPRSDKPISFSIDINFRHVEAMFLNANINIPEPLISNIIVHVEHADFIIAKSLVNHVEEWVASLSEPSESKFLRYAKFFSKYLDPFSRYVIGFGVALTASIYFSKNNSSELYTSNNLMAAAWFFIGVYFILITIDLAISRYIKNSIASYTESSCFNITSGDQNKIKNRISRNKGMRLLLSAFFGLFIVNISISFFAAYLFEIAKPYLLQ